MIHRKPNGVVLPIEARLDNLDAILPRVERFLQTQAEINLKHAERQLDNANRLDRIARDVEALRMYAAGGWRTRLLAKRLLLRLEKEGKAVASPASLAQETARYIDEDRARVEFSAWVVIGSVIGGALVVGGLLAWWACS